MSAIVLQPDWIVPITEPAIHHGYLVVDAGRIVFVGKSLPTRFASVLSIQLDGCILLPGLINSHCHLEFSDLSSPIPAGASFVDWLQRVMIRRREDAARSPEAIMKARAAAIQSGYRESWRSGVRWIVDNVTAPWDRLWIEQVAKECLSRVAPLARAALVPDSLLQIQPCFELLDVTSIRNQQTNEFATKQVIAPKSLSTAPGGLAPHAPYTASLEVTRAAAAWSRSNKGLVTMHLAESLEELEWLQSRSGDLGDWIRPHLDARHLNQIGTVLEHLQALSGAWRGLVVHGNYLTKQDANFLLDHRERMAVVYCPRTHAFFGHGEHPARALAERSVPVFLGTDSRASNPNLSIWEEVQFLSRQIGMWEPSQVASMASCGPATFLAAEGVPGSLRDGGLAQLTAFTIEPSVGERAGIYNTEQQVWEYLIAKGEPYPLELHPAFNQL